MTYIKPTLTIILSILSSLIVISAQQRTVGLMLNTEEAYNGFTLWGNNNDSYLIDNCGQLRHQWRSEYVPGTAQYLLPDGSLLRTGREMSAQFNSSGTGGIFQKLEWDSKVNWEIKYYNEDFHPHHDIEPLPNGNFLAIVWDKVIESEAIELGRQTRQEFWSEKIVEIEPIGHDDYRIVWEWRVIDHLIQDVNPSLSSYGIISDHPHRINSNYGDISKKDWLHFNAIEYNASLDQIAISVFGFGEVWIIDHSTTTAEAKTSNGGRSGLGGDLLYRFGNPHAYKRGTIEDRQFYNQHDVRWTSDTTHFAGHLMVFNNKYRDNQSRVELWQLPIDSKGSYSIDDYKAFGPDTISWFFTAPNFYAPNRSGAEMLPNGNVLICQAQFGQFFEITKDKKLIWNYINPINAAHGPMHQGDPVLNNETFRIERYPHDYPPFLTNDIRPKGPIELNPVEIECELPLEFTSTYGWNIHVEHPASAILRINNLESDRVPYQIINSNGQTVQSEILLSGRNEENITHLSSGIYILIIGTKQNILHSQSFLITH